jgi:hypothetical protein
MLVTAVEADSYDAAILYLCPCMRLNSYIPEKTNRGWERHVLYPFPLSYRTQ